MTTQPEAVLEANLVTQLIGLKYESVSIKDEAELLANLKASVRKAQPNNLITDRI
jgi:type I restriction enzyme R subunit